MKKETIWRIVIYISGVMLLSMGAVLGTRTGLGLGKNILDIGCVTFSFLVDVLFGTIWTSIGVATVIAVVAYGRLVYLFNRLLKEKLLALAGLSPEN